MAATDITFLIADYNMVSQQPRYRQLDDTARGELLEMMESTPGGRAFLEAMQRVEDKWPGVCDALEAEGIFLRERQEKPFGGLMIVFDDDLGLITNGPVSVVPSAEGPGLLCVQSGVIDNRLIDADRYESLLWHELMHQIMPIPEPIRTIREQFMLDEGPHKIQVLIQDLTNAAPHFLPDDVAATVIAMLAEKRLDEAVPLFRSYMKDDWLNPLFDRLTELCRTQHDIAAVMQPIERICDTFAAIVSDKPVAVQEAITILETGKTDVDATLLTTAREAGVPVVREGYMLEEHPRHAARRQTHDSMRETIDAHRAAGTFLHR